MKNVVFLIALFSWVLPADVHAQDVCSNSSIRGQYSFVVSGTIGGAPFAAAGLGIYDGHGNVQGVIQASSNGIVNPAAGWSGAYSVKAMTAGEGQSVCVLTKSINVPGYNNLVVSFFVTAADSFKELRFIATSPGTTLSGTATRD